MNRQSWIGSLGVLIMVLALVAGCGDRDEKRMTQALAKFGPSMDAARKEQAILPIPANAGCQLADETSLRWMSGDADASHMEKTVVFDKGITVPVSETDRVRSPKGMLTVETTYGADGKTIAQQVFKMDDKEMAAAQGKALLKDIMNKDTNRPAPAAPAIEEVLRNK
jgi:hypothetical protein